MKKCLSLIAVMLIVVIVLAGCSNSTAPTSSNSPDPVPVVFDALQFKIATENNSMRLMTESELIDAIGEPEDVDEWVYTQLNGDKYAIKTLVYENGKYEYNLSPSSSSDEYIVVRISINDAHIPYSSSNDILSMFNLSGFSNTTIEADTGLAYRVKIGNLDFWVWDMDDNYLEGIKITYIDGLFGE